MRQLRSARHLALVLGAVCALAIPCAIEPFAVVAAAPAPPDIEDTVAIGDTPGGEEGVDIEDPVDIGETASGSDDRDGPTRPEGAGTARSSGGTPSKGGLGHHAGERSGASEQTAHVRPSDRVDEFPLARTGAPVLSFLWLGALAIVSGVVHLRARVC